MRHLLLATVVLFCGTTSWALGQEEGGLEQALASASPNGLVKFVLWQAIPETATATRNVTVMEARVVKFKELVNGKEVEREKTETFHVTRPEQYTFVVWKSVSVEKRADPQHTRYYETDGRKVDPQTLSRRLAKQTLVVVRQDGKPLPSHFASIFRPGTLIVSMEPLPPAGPAPISAPEKPERLPGKNLDPPAKEQPRDEETEGPKGPAPQFQFFSLSDGKLNIRRTNERSFRQTAYRESVASSGTRTYVPFSMTIIDRTSHIVQVDPQNVQLATADGKRIEPRQLPQLLPDEQAGIVSLDGKPVEPFWLQNIEPSVLVVMLPDGAPMGHGADGHGMPRPGSRAAAGRTAERSAEGDRE